jgi:uncharacterized membrane protein
MATGTLSPRFMRLWYRDRLQKLVLASFAGTFTYSYALLSGVEQDDVPSIGGHPRRVRGRRASFCSCCT